MTGRPHEKVHEGLHLLVGLRSSRRRTGRAGKKEHFQSITQRAGRQVPAESKMHTE